MKRSILALGLLLFFSVSGWAGSSTPKGFLYKPALGARGDAEKNLYDAGLDRVDARLGKEIWLGDPGGSPGYNTLANALATIGSNQAILRLPAGAITIADNTAIPANVTLKPERGATFSIAANKTMTINGGLDAGLYPIFSGPGKVIFGKGKVEAVHPEWWGFSDTAVDTANATAVQAAFDALLHTDVNYGGTIKFTQGGNIKGPINVMSSVTITGTSCGFPKLVNTSIDGADLFYIKNTRDANPIPFRVRIQDLRLDGTCNFGAGQYSGNAVHIYAPYQFSMERVYITNHGGMGVKTIKGEAPYAYYQNVEIKNCQINANRMGGIKLGSSLTTFGGNLARITSCTINSNGYFGVYSDKIYQLQIRDTEFAGYYYGAFITAHQAIPIALNGGSLSIIEGCSFENNAGNGATPTQSIRTGWDPEAQALTTNTTASLIVRNCGFSIPGTAIIDGALDCIHLHYAQTVTIEENQFDRTATNKYEINAVKLGTVVAYAQLLLKNNKLNSYPYDGINLLAGNLNGVQYTVIDSTPDVVLGLASDILLANDLKAKMNAHAANASAHTTAIDNVNFPIVTADAAGTGHTGMTSLIALTTSLLTAYAAHEADAALSSGWAFHKGKETASHALLSAAAPANYTECHQRLMFLSDRYNTSSGHDYDSGAHGVIGQHQQSATTVAARLSNAFRFHGTEDTSPVLTSQRPQYPHNDAFRIETNGKLNWGLGTSSTWTSLYMDPSNYNLRTDRKLCADGGIGVGNAVSGDVTGTAKTMMLRVFDAAGNPIGYLQVYAGP